MASLDLARRDDYLVFLSALARVTFPLEQRLRAAGVERVLADWNVRARAAALRQDFADLDALPPPPAELAVDLRTEARLLGAVYVLEGSRLGGAVLIRAVAPHFPTAFLKPGNPGAWRAFVNVLDQRLSSSARVSEAAETARLVFEAFEQAAHAAFGARSS